MQGKEPDLFILTQSDLKNVLMSGKKKKSRLDIYI